MPPTSEAACLLDSGSLYFERALLVPESGEPVFAGRKRGAFSLYHGDSPVFHCDDEGRWQRVFVGGTHYLKGLDGAVQALERVRAGKGLVLHRRTLPFAEASVLDARVRDNAKELASGLASGRFQVVGPSGNAAHLSTEELMTYLGRIAAWDAAAWLTQRERYQSAYGPVSFLPPDDLNALLFQASVGDADGLAFGGACPLPYRPKTVDEFEAHVAAVARLVGRRLAQYRHAFLAGEDLLLRTDDFYHYLMALSAAFPVDPTGGRDRGGGRARPVGIHAFLDRFPASGPPCEDWKNWRELGLRRVTLGVASGDARGRPCDLVRAAEGAASAGVDLSVVVAAPLNQIDQLEVLLLRLPLKAGDLVTLLDPPGMTAQDVKRALGRLRAERKVKVVPYSREKQGDRQAPENGAYVQSSA